ncbi:MAG: transposase [Smithella sp.]
MKYNPAIHHRHSIRLKGYDYSQTGAYFITVCTHNRECLFCFINDDEITTNEYGDIVRREWMKTPEMRANVELDEFIIMPNHVHGIIMINECRGVLQYAPTKTQTKHETKFQSPSNTIGAIIRGFKSAVTRQINEMRQTPGVPIWQCNYYEHIIRNDDELNRVREYIINNPINWQTDENNPVGAGPCACPGYDSKEIYS